MDIKRQPVVIVFSILAGLQVINGGLMLIDSIDKDIAGLFSLILGAVTAAASVYVRGMVTPWVDVVSKITSSGNVVAGPAAGVGNTGIVGPNAGGTPSPPAPPAPPVV
jgi:hypothetical protein